MDFLDDESDEESEAYKVLKNNLIQKINNNLINFKQIIYRLIKNDLKKN
jgi:hypothetical protein